MGGKQTGRRMGRISHVVLESRLHRGGGESGGAFGPPMMHECNQGKEGRQADVILEGVRVILEQVPAFGPAQTHPRTP